MKVKKVKSLINFIESNDEHWHPIHHWVFRGVPNANFGLRPTLGRHRIQKPDWILNREMCLLEDFKRRAANLLEKNPSGDLEWLCVARHYGLATRLLDWTQNALVALYFAAHSDIESDFAVYCMFGGTHLGADCSDMQLEDIQKRDDEVLFFPRWTSPRLISQSAVFLLCSKPWEDFNGSDDYTVEKYVFPAACRKKLRYQLRMLDITSAVVWADLQGLAQDINDLYFYIDRERFPLPPPDAKMKQILREFKKQLGQNAPSKRRGSR